MNTNQPPKSGTSRRARRTALILFLVVAGIGSAGWGWYRYKFPYGLTHRCAVGLGLGLRLYANDHNGWLPHGEATPEASLGLLAKDDMSTALWVFGGKDIPQKVVKAALAPGGHFGPASCGWHYIEGLRDDDDGQIAVCWDKAIGLGHDGQRVRGMAHEIVRLDGSHAYISQAEWPRFVADQNERLAKVKESRPTNAPPIRWSDEASLGTNRFPAPRH